MSIAISCRSSGSAGELSGPKDRSHRKDFLVNQVASEVADQVDDMGDLVEEVEDRLGVVQVFPDGMKRVHFSISQPMIRLGGLSSRSAGELGRPFPGSPHR